MIRRTLPFALITALALAPVCQAHPSKPEKGFEATLPPDTPDDQGNGAIYNPHTIYIGLIQGARAHAVGDIVTINLVENFTTTKQAIGKIAKSGSFNVTPPTKGPLAINANALNSSGTLAFSGEGDASENSQLGGQISVTIAEARRNGTLLVKGQKRLLLSQGEEWVQISGIIRVTDIDLNNTVQSYQVADAHIVYTGNGTIGRASRQGWLGRFFSIINPF
jgi:flagellar L-ring protein FlgH